MEDRISPKPFRYKWAAWGDLNAFFGLMLDNVTNLVLLWVLLAGAGFPSDVFFSRMVPGTALGVLVGDLIYTWMAFRLAKKTGNPKVTAMPLGLDTPSTIGVALAVLIPAFRAAQAGGMDPHAAAMVSWKIGMATLIFMGVVKTVTAFFGEYVQKVVPQAGLLGSLAGVGVTLLGFIPLMHMFEMPEVGLVALGPLVFTLVARFDLPWRLPGAFAAQVSAAVGLHTFSMIGIPVSTSQAIVGAVMGVGLVHGIRTVSRRKVGEIVIGWIATPLVSGATAFGLYWVILRMGY